MARFLWAVIPAQCGFATAMTMLAVLTTQAPMMAATQYHFQSIGSWRLSIVG